MSFLRKLFGKGEKARGEVHDEEVINPEGPSYFYKCPHCNHILLKDSMMMKFAGTGMGIATLGGGCPDCGGSLNGETVYVDWVDKSVGYCQGYTPPVDPVDPTQPVPEDRIFNLLPILIIGGALLFIFVIWRKVK